MNDEQVKFVETDAEAVASEMVARYEQLTGRTLYPADPVRQLILWDAAIEVQARANINAAANENLPRFAHGAFQDCLAELFKDLTRLEPQAAKTTLRFALSEAREESVTIPKGTRATPDGEVIFATDEELTIPAGDPSGDVAARCTVTGEAGNGLLPGQINKTVDGIPYVDTVTNITTSEGGAGEESQQEFYERMRENPETYSTAGPMGAYEYYAKTASTLVEDVKPTSPSPGVADIRILLKGGELPGEELLALIGAALSDKTVRPLTDHVQVKAPEVMKYSIDFTYYTPQDATQSRAETAEKVSAAVEQYKRWQSAKIGRDINPDKLREYLYTTGIKRLELRSPVFTPVPDGSDSATPPAVAVIESVNIQDGGAEDE